MRIGLFVDFFRFYKRVDSYLKMSMFDLFYVSTNHRQTYVFNKNAISSDIHTCTAKKISNIIKI